MKKIYVYKVEIFEKQSGFLHENVFKEEITEIGLENDTYIVLNDAIFTKLSKESKYATNPVLNKEHIWERKWKFARDLDGIVYSLYSETPRKPEVIKRHIEKFIKEQYAWVSAIDLSFIK